MALTVLIYVRSRTEGNGLSNTSQKYEKDTTESPY